MSASRRLHDSAYLQLLLKGIATEDMSRHGRVVWYNGTYGTSPFNGRQSFLLDGTDDVLSITGGVGTIWTVAFLVKPATTTEQLIRLDTDKKITVAGGTITYTGVTGAYTYVDGLPSTTLAAGAWQHVTCVLSAACAATLFAVGYYDPDYGELECDRVRAYSVALTGDEAACLSSYDRR